MIKKSYINWGILGTGNMANKFIEAINMLKHSNITGVASRNINRSKEICKKHNIKNAYESYNALISDDNIDIVYICTLNNSHYDLIYQSLIKNKSVLCEKPFTLNSDEAEKVIKIAKDRNLFLMEAMWSRFVPSILECKRLIKNGAIGEIKLMISDFGTCVEKSIKRLFEPNLGGGVLYDRGIYCLSLANFILGVPSEIQVCANVGKTRVDEQIGVVLNYPENKMALISSTLLANTNKEIHFFGTEGKLSICSPLYYPKSFIINKNDKIESYDFKLMENGFVYEALEVENCLLNNKPESDQMNLKDTLNIMKTIDIIRSKINYNNGKS